jgi:ABC-type polysaccharide/polyol phosphate export permease
VTSSTLLYDSAQRNDSVLGVLRNLWNYRGLIRLIVERDLTVRYKRSVLGIWWTLLNPLLMTGVFWLVFSKLFARPGDDVPYVIFLVTGVVTVSYFTQGVVACGSSLVNSRGILIKVYVPPEIFALATAIAAAVNYVIALVPLAVLMVLLGVGFPLTFLLVVPLLFAMLLLVAGVGLLVAAAAVYFYDILDLVKVLMQLILFGSATFYPLSIIPERFVFLMKLNPVFHYVDGARDILYRGELPGLLSSAMIFGSAAAAFGLGVWVFSRSWHNLVVRL